MKSLVNVQTCHIHWQPQGKILAVKIDRQKNKKSPVFTSFEFLRVYEKNIPIEGVELSKDTVIAFAFEPKGTRFAIIHADATQAATTKPNVSIYNIEEHKITLLKTFDQRSANHLYWSPQGRYLVLAGLKSMNPQIEFLDIDTLESITKETHQLCTDVTWDYTGRFCTTYVSNWKNKNENGFMIWSCRGKKVYSLNKDPFYQFLWRPVPPTLLSKEELEALTQPTNFKKYQKKYKSMERAELDAVTSKRRAEQERLKSEYRTLLSQRMKDQEDDVAWRKSVGIYDDTADDFYVVEECIEEILEEKFEPIES
jgi:translation initiation factor 3 subunit B